jgi:Spy/CpxP family protein refolding chaperone
MAQRTRSKLRELRKQGCMSRMENFSFILVTGIAIVFCLGVGSAAGQSSNAVAQPAPAQQDQGVSDQDIQMLRKNLREQRRQVITANMKLTDAEAQKFWPLYDQYISDLVKINNTKYDLIKQYLQAKGNLSDAQADSAVKQWIGVDQSVSDLRLKYVPAFRKILSAKNTALFYQVDRRIQLMIDLQLVSALPMAEP